MTAKRLLNEYLKFDYLNKNLNSPQIKIFVSYIKPSFLFKTNILTPIHLGRAVEKDISKDGLISDLEIDWLHKNCISDDDFIENISSLNRRVGFLTGTYYAYKNYNKLNNPQYFGSFGYRRLFHPECLCDLGLYDLIIPFPRKIKTDLKTRLIQYLGDEFYNNVFDVLSKLCSSEISEIIEYLLSDNIYFDEIYIMRKNIFFNFCEWIFPILFELLKIPQNVFSSTHQLTNRDILYFKNDKRDIAYIMEFLTGYFIFKYRKTLSYKHCEVILLNKDKNINIYDILRKRISSCKK